MKKKCDQTLSLLLAAAMILSLLCPAALAAELSGAGAEGSEAALLSQSEDGNAAPESPQAEDFPSDDAREPAPESSLSSDTQDEHEGAADASSGAPDDAESPDRPADSSEAENVSAGDAEAESTSDPVSLPTREEAAASVSPQEESEPPSTASAEEEPGPAQHLEVSSADQLSDYLITQWRDDYFQEAVVDTKRNRVTVDGERASVAEVFGQEADQEAILDSPQAAEAYFEDTAFETESLGGGKVSVTSPWQTCRIVVTAPSLAGDFGAQTVVEYPKYHQFVLQFPDEESTREAYETLSQTYSCYVDEILSAESVLQETETQTWGYEDMGFNTPKNSQVFSDAQTVQVAIIDTGCDTSTGFFKGRSFSRASKAFTDADSPYIDYKSTSHGTHVAGIVHTCTPANVELMILRIMDSNGKLSTLNADLALKHALENGADVINFSLGNQDANASSMTALNQSLHLAREKGVPVVCSAGNQSLDVSTNYPACHADAIAVSAVNRSHQFAYTFSETPDASVLGQGGSGSSYGSGIDFCAPGVGVVSAVKGGTAGKNGTSMAAPHITAAFAWLCLEDPSANWTQLYERLQELCVDLGEPGRDELYGWGYPNLSTLGIPAPTHEHSWNTVVTAPTCVSEGYTTYTCSGCDEVRIRDYVGPTHSFNDQGLCTVCGEQRNAVCGRGVTWTYSPTTETLTITGDGEDQAGSVLTTSDGQPSDNDFAVTTPSWENLYPSSCIRCVVLNHVTSLGDDLFSDYPALESINLGEDLESIGQNTLRGCPALTELTLPASLDSLGTGALTACSSLSRITSESSSFTVTQNCLLWTRGKTQLLVCGGGWSGDTLTLPTALTGVAPHACEGVSGLTKLILSTRLSQLGAESFAGCGNLTEIYARSNVAALGENAFEGVTATVSVSQGCTGWEEDKRAALGGSLTWTSYVGNLAEWTMSLTSNTWSYTGSSLYPGITLTQGDTVVRNYTRGGIAPNHANYFSYSYTNNRDLASATDGENAPTATIKGKGIYYGTQSLPFTIKLATPTVYAPVRTDTGVQVGWKSVTGAKWYQLLRKEGEGNWIDLSGAVTDQTSFLDTTVVNGRTYSYSVWCCTEAYYENPSETLRSRYQATQPTITCLATPTLTSVRLLEDGSMSVAWESVDGASFYRLMRKDESSAWQTLAEGLTGTSATDSSPIQGGANWYTVQAVAADASGSACSSGLSADCLAAPVLTGAVCEGSGVRLSWSGVNGAAGYQAFCKTDNGNWQAAGSTSDTSLLLTTSDGGTPLRSGTVYTFTVRCMAADGATALSGWNASGISLRYLSAPALNSAACAAGGVLLSWAGTEGAAGYRVYCAPDNGDWSAVGDTTASSLLVTTGDGSAALQSGTSYRFTVRAIGAEGNLSDWNADGLSLVYLSVPVLSGAVNEGSGIRVGWNAVPGAARYRVFWATDNGGWKAAGDTSGTSLLLSASKLSLKTGQRRRFTVRCVSANGLSYTSDYDAAGRSCVYVPAPTLTGVKNTKKQKLTVKWKMVSGASGYQVQAATNQRFTANIKSVKVKGVRKLTGTLTKLKKKKTYWVRVRCWRKSGGVTGWSGWSKVKKVKIKK